MRGPATSSIRVPKLHLLAIATVYAASRALYYAAGARFDDVDLDSMWHFVSPELLRGRLIESVLHLHFQPPLYNLYLGVMLKLFGAHAHGAFAVSYHLVGLAFACALLVLMRACGAGPRTALLLSALLVVSPAHLLFETFLLYSHPVMAALTLSVLALHAAARRGTSAAWAVYFGLLAGIVLTRALFHPVWLVAVAGCAIALRRADRRQVLIGAMLPLLLVGLWCGKNWVMFGTPGTSSWLGMGLARMTLRHLPAAPRDRWIAEHELSPLAAIRPPGSLEDYARVLPLPPPTGIAVLDQRRKPSGAMNLHHLAYVEISRRLAQDARFVLLHQPSAYAASVRGAFRRFVSPATDWHAFARNRARIQAYVDAYAAVIHFPSLFGRSGLMLFALPGLTLFGGIAAFRRLRADRHDATGLALAFMSSTVAYVTLTGCLLEPRENMRFRYMVEPLLWVLLAVAVEHLRSRRTRRSARGSAAGNP